MQLEDTGSNPKNTGGIEAMQLEDTGSNPKNTGGIEAMQLEDTGSNPKNTGGIEAMQLEDTGIGVEEPYLLNRYQILAKNLNFSVFHRDDLDQNNFRYKRSDVNNFGGVAVSSMRYMEYGRLGISGARSDKGGKSGGLPIGNNDNLINRQLTSCHPTHPNRADSYSCRGDSLTQVPHGLPVNITKL
ncbi:hypothetical protein RRG08_035627 [Elysia crispata]|uniref:Uncharacterized protein n=1 Tax=Elysia crispata TaxID=231223 RepID=A0AAE1DQ53_9GAST|nr:hypothetical protein RRG08_035627 [Elysia crispata]